MSELFFKKGATVNLYDARYSLPPDTHEELTAIIDENNKIGDKARDEMEAVFVKAQEDMRRIIPELNMKSFRDDMIKRISTLEKRSTEAMKALSAGVSELDSLRNVMKLQSRVIAGESLDTLLAKLTDANELLALCDLAQQTNNSQLAQQATDIWHQGTMKSLFVYDDHAKLTINLIYDERQAESSARNQELRILQNTQQYTQSEKQKIQQLHAELDRTNDELDLQKTNYQSKVDQYNQLINTLNQSHQNLDATARLQLDQQKNQLIIEQNQLKQQLDIYNQKVYELNRQVGQLNAVNQQYNQSVDHFNSRFQPRQFDKGVFDGKTINIYEFASDADLRVTIAHELGHALGLAHNNDPKALMYPMMKEQDLKNFRLTTADLAMLNSRQR